MNSILNAQAPAHFLTGLALFAIAGMIGVALRRAAGQRALGCGLATLISLALAQWSELAAGALARPTICQAVRLVCEMIALVGLIELGRLCTTGPRAGLLPRWSYPMVAALTLAGALLPTLGPLEFILRLAIGWQAGWLAAGYFRRDKESVTADSRATIGAIEPSTVAARSMAGGLLVYLVATCVAIPLLGMIATLVAAGAAYVAFGPSPKQSRQSRLLALRVAGWLRSLCRRRMLCDSHGRRNRNRFAGGRNGGTGRQRRRGRVGQRRRFRRRADTIRRQSKYRR
jgi:hypothetical protein